MMPGDPEARVRAAVEELTAAIMAALAAPKVDPNAPERLLNLDQVCQALGVKRSTVYTLMQKADGGLHGIAIGRRRLFASGELRDYIARQAAPNDGKGRP